MIRRRIPKRPNVRQAEICDLVSKRGAMSVDVLAERFETSAETIRRDLTTLADAGQIQKVHGGARSLSPQDEGAFDTRMRRNALAKRLIAEKVAGLVTPPQTLFLDTGSTTLICAEALARIKKLTVITNSVRIAATLAKGNGKADVYLLGGRFREGNTQTVGTYVTNQIKNFRADTAIITIGGIDTHGTMDFSSREAQVAQAMIEASAKTIIVADHSKYNRSASFNVCGLNEFDTLVSDKLPDATLAKALGDSDIDVY